MLEATKTEATSPAFSPMLPWQLGSQHTHCGNKTEERDPSCLCERSVSMQSYLCRDSEDESAASAAFEHRVL